jgi:hypothetical protein
VVEATDRRWARRNWTNLVKTFRFRPRKPGANVGVGSRSTDVWAIVKKIAVHIARTQVGHGVVQKVRVNTTGRNRRTRRTTWLKGEEKKLVSYILLILLRKKSRQKPAKRPKNRWSVVSSSLVGQVQAPRVLVALGAARRRRIDENESAGQEKRRQKSRKARAKKNTDVVKYTATHTAARRRCKEHPSTTTSLHRQQQHMKPQDQTPPKKM